MKQVANNFPNRNGFSTPGPFGRTNPQPGVGAGRFDPTRDQPRNLRIWRWRKLNGWALGEPLLCEFIPFSAGQTNTPADLRADKNAVVHGDLNTERMQRDHG